MGEEMDIAVSIVFSMIAAGVKYLREAGVQEEVIDANWETVTKPKHAARPSEDLPTVE
jgi:hypothetical protein